MSAMSEVAVIQAADDGYAEVFAAHRGAVYRLACMLSGDTAVAEEVTAEVFAKVLPKWRADNVADPLSYLRRAVVNELRSRWRRVVLERRAVHQASLRRDPEGVDRLALRDPLTRALARLPLQQRSVVVLRFMDDLSEKAVAGCLGLNVGTVKSQASRGLARLRELLEHGE
jgi:RNA polymerase sigma-70 factor (sigma-E family)